MINNQTMIEDKINIFKVKDIIAEDYINYKKCSMFIATCLCDFKCEKEDSNIHCQNSRITQQDTITLTIDNILKMFENSFSEALVIGGLEPFLQFGELVTLIAAFKNKYKKLDIVMYTGYTETEVNELKYQDKNIFDYINENDWKNIIIKFGRYKSNLPIRYDDILGVTLISNNQYAKIYNKEL